MLVCREFFHEAIVIRFGIPRILITSKDRQFVNVDFEEYLMAYIIQHGRSSVAYLQSMDKMRWPTAAFFNLTIYWYHEQIPIILGYLWTLKINLVFKIVYFQISDYISYFESNYVISYFHKTLFLSRRGLKYWFNIQTDLWFQIFTLRTGWLVREDWSNVYNGSEWTNPM